MLLFLVIASVLISCDSHRKFIKKQEVASVPHDQYQRIIKLYNPEGMPDKTLAGLVFVKKGAKICTNYPREETIKSLDELESIEKHAYPDFTTYAIQVGKEIFGFIAIPVEYNVNVWETKKNNECQFKVDIVIPHTIKGIGGPFLGPGGIVPAKP